jgi:hypothetical protein
VLSLSLIFGTAVIKQYGFYKSSLNTGKCKTAQANKNIPQETGYPLEIQINE